MVKHDYEMKISKLAISVAVSISASIFSVSTNANGLQSEMDNLFQGMSNATLPGVYESQRRGVIAGGRVTAKTKIIDENLVSFAPPSWKAGCGGVDMFGGSLSFVNADQIVQLMRAVAANAKGYAFQLALDTAFPSGAKWIENFQKKVQALNQHLGNSCQLAQGIVNDSIGAFTKEKNNKASIIATSSGLYEDIFASKSESTGKSPEQELQINNHPEYTKMIGNIVWKQLKANNANSWFRYGDNTLLEAIMSLTGTVIISDLVNDPAMSGEKTNIISTLPGNKISLKDLINGGTSISIYSCGSDTENCFNAGTTLKTISLKGIQDQITDMLLGTGSTPGIIYKFSTNSGDLNSYEKSFMSSLPGGMGAIIRNLSVLSMDAANLFAIESSGAIALTIMFDFVEDFFRAGHLALANSDSSYKKEVLRLIDQSQVQIRYEYQSLRSQYGNLSDQIERYNNLLDNIRKQRYMLATLSKPPSTN